MQQLLTSLNNLVERWQERKASIITFRLESIRGDRPYDRDEDHRQAGRETMLDSCTNELIRESVAYQAKIANLIDTWRASGKHTTSDDPTYDNTRENVLNSCADALEELLK